MGRPHSFDVIGPDGRRVTIQPRSEGDTIADLLSALGHPAANAVLLDGWRALATQRLVDVTALRAGVQVDLEPPGPPAASRDGARQPVVEVAVIAGPACRAWLPLAPGRWTIGRSVHTTVRLTDPAVELHHGSLEIDDAGVVRFTQLTGRVPARVDGVPCGPGEAIPVGAVLEIGASLVTVRPIAARARSSPGTGSIVGGPDPWRAAVRRGPVGEAGWEHAELAVPLAPAAHPAPPATGLIGAAVAVVGALVMATVVGRPMFALFALVGAAASLATWISGLIGAARRRRRDRRDHRACVDRFRAAATAAIDERLDHERHHHRTVVEALDELATLGGRIWERRPPQDAELRATVGLARSCWLPPVTDWSAVPPDVAADLERHAVADHHPAPVALAPGGGVAVHGAVDDARAAIRALLVQLAVWTGPADWQLLVVSPDVDRWSWAAWLPHAVRADGSAGVVAPGDVDGAGALLARDRTTVVVTDDPGSFDARTGPLRRLVDATGAAVVVAVPRDVSVPSICSRVLRCGSTGRAEWADASPVDGRSIGLHVTGLDEPTAECAVRVLASLVDPEDASAASSALPTSISFAELDATTSDGGDGSDRDPVGRIVDRWRAGGRDPAPSTPIGLSADGVVDIDLVRDGPHGLIAGTTGAGKSELLRTLVVGLATRSGPDHLTFVLVDYKGGSTFDACERLPHTVGSVTDLDEGGAARALVSLEAELRRRERLLRDVRAADLADYRRRDGVATLPRLAVVVDEFAALAQELPDFLSSLVGIAQRGRSLGVHLILATQRPSGVVSDDIRANTNLRLALRLHDTADARDIVGDDLPATLARGLAGRAVLRLGPGELVVFQAARCTSSFASSPPRLTVVSPHDPPPGDAAPDGPTELTATVDAIVAASDRLGLDAPHRPWLEALPAPLDPCHVDRHVDGTGVLDQSAGSCGHDAVGLVDDPERQARRALRWDPAGGNLGLVGALGSGTTSTLVALAAAICRTSPPERVHLYVVDALGDRALDGLESIAHCGAVVRVHDQERLHRLLDRLVCEIDERLGGRSPDVRVVVLVDGFDSLRAALSSIERAETLAALDRIVADGPAVGIACAASGTDLGRLPAADRWEFDQGGPPGRLRVASSGLEAQVARGAPGLAALADRSDGRGPAAVETLADRIDRRSLGRSRAAGDGRARVEHLVVGRSATRLDDAELIVPAGDHLLVGGPSRSGKTTALRGLVAAWRELHPAGVVVEVDRHRSFDEDELGAGPALVVVDDADRVDDPAVAALVADHRPGVTVMAAARADAVRAMYGHWTRDVVRSRCGLVLTSSGDVDGELFGVTLPRRTLIAPRPGLAWLIDATGERLAQLAS